MEIMHKISEQNSSNSVISVTVLLAALGYFVDIYDLILFSVVRIPSLRSLGVAEAQLLDVGLRLLNIQMLGMLLGGVIFGILSDKKGRVSMLFGSIFLYSLATLANAFVNSIAAYGVLRFLAGIGLAGELGIAITLVSEIMPKETRGYGTSLVAGIGVCGGAAATLVAHMLTWQAAYILGGIMGLLLLVLRMRLVESDMYRGICSRKIPKGDFRLLFTSRKNLLTYLGCMFIGLPMWFVFGLLVTLAPEFGRALNVQGTISSGFAVAACCLGMALGDVSSGVLSQYAKSRKKIIACSLILFSLCISMYLFASSPSQLYVYALYILMGYTAGYWALFITMTAELFGTNMRAMVATSIPNFVRGLVIPCTLIFGWLTSYFGVATSAFIVGILCTIGAFIGLAYVKETFGKELDYVHYK